MNLISRTATAVVAALALSLPTAALTSAAQAAPSSAGQAGASQAGQHDQAMAKKAKKKKVKVKLKRSAKYSHVGQKGVKVTAVVSKGKKKAKGKVSFTLNGAAAATKKL